MITYQGGKARLSKRIVEAFPPFAGRFFDLCCGSGWVSLAVREFLTPDRIVMVDIGPWGTFWRQIGEGSFDLDFFRFLISCIPTNPTDQSSFMRRLSKEPPSIPAFLILQSASFGGKAIWIEDSKWHHHGFRKSHPNCAGVMMPGPKTLLERVLDVSQKMRGILAGQIRIEDLIDVIKPDDLVYIDPPYSNSVGYVSSCDLDLFRKLPCWVFVSEAKPLSDHALRLSGARTQGGISGKRKSSNEEWISIL